MIVGRHERVSRQINQVLHSKCLHLFDERTAIRIVTKYSIPTVATVANVKEDVVLYAIFPAHSWLGLGWLKVTPSYDTLLRKVTFFSDPSDRGVHIFSSTLIPIGISAWAGTVTV